MMGGKERGSVGEIGEEMEEELARKYLPSSDRRGTGRRVEEECALAIFNHGTGTKNNQRDS